jgi:hypothetical protein
MTDGPLGTVTLHFREPVFAGRRWQLALLGNNRIVDIAPYVEQWPDSDLLHAIHQFAPQVEIPAALLQRPRLAFYQRPSIIALGLPAELCAVAVLALIARPSILTLIQHSGLPASVYNAWAMAHMALLGSMIGGMLLLPGYHHWLTTTGSTGGIAPLAIRFYAHPFVGFAIGLAVGAVLLREFRPFRFGR